MRVVQKGELPGTQKTWQTVCVNCHTIYRFKTSEVSSCSDPLGADPVEYTNCPLKNCGWSNDLVDADLVMRRSATGNWRDV